MKGLIRSVCAGGGQLARVIDCDGGHRPAGGRHCFQIFDDAVGGHKIGEDGVGQDFTADDLARGVDADDRAKVLIARVGGAEESPVGGLPAGAERVAVPAMVPAT